MEADQPKTKPVRSSIPLLYRIGRGLFRLTLGFYFSRIQRFHAERVPGSGPVFFTANHPNSVADAFVIGTSVSRKVNFVGTVQLFRWRAVCWLLTRCGVIAINRVKDDPRAMRTVLQTFEACFRVLEKGEAVGIFVEGLTSDDPQLKTVKTGAARMALELEERHGGRLGLQLVPTGLTYSAKDRYRSTALVYFGEPIKAADYLAGYHKNRHDGIQALTAELERRIQALMLHLPHLERARIVDAVKRLYLDRLWAGNTVIHEPVPPEAGELLLTKAIAARVEQAFEEHPARAEEFVRRLNHYERELRALHLSDEILAHFPDRRHILAHSLWLLVVMVIGAPVALYGWIHRILPYFIMEGASKKFAKQPADRTHIATTNMLAGILAFTLFYSLYTVIFHLLVGWPWTVWYALSLPVASLLAHYWLGEFRRFEASLRAAVVLLRAPAAGQRLLAERAEMIRLIDIERSELLRPGRAEDDRQASAIPVTTKGGGQ